MLSLSNSSILHYLLKDYFIYTKLDQRDIEKKKISVANAL